MGCNQAKAKGARKLGYSEFERALELVAEKKVWVQRSTAWHSTRQKPLHVPDLVCHCPGCTQHRAAEDALGIGGAADTRNQGRQCEVAR